MSFRSTLLLCLAGSAAGIGAGSWSRHGKVTASASESASQTVSHRAAPSPPVPPGQVAAADFPQWVAEALAASQPNTLRLQALFMRWIEKEPDLWPRFQELEQQFPSAAGALTSAFFTAWAWKDCEAACTRIAGSSLKERRQAIAAVWAVACALEHPRAATLEAGLFVKDFSPLERMARRNPQLALQILPGLRDHQNAGTLAVMRGWAAVDGRAAVEWAATVQDNSGEVFRTACAEWHRRDPAALARLDGVLRERALRDDAISALMGITQEQNPYATPRGSARAAIAMNPFATAEELLALLKSSPVLLKPVTEPWYRGADDWQPADAAAAMQSLTAQPPGAARDFAASALLLDWHSENPQAAAGFAAEHGLTLPERPPSPFDAWKAAAALPFDQATAHFLSLPRESNEKWNGLSGTVSRMVSNDPAAATSFLAAHAEECTGTDSRWWLVFHNAAMAWSQTDVAAASEWAAALPAGPVRDAVAGGMMQELSEYDPEAALTWIATMKNRDSGSGDLRGVIGNLKNALGEVGARRVVEHSGLSDATRQEALKFF